MIVKLVNWLMRTRLYNFLLSKVIPFIRTTTYYPDFPGRKYIKAYAILQPGDVIYCDDNKKLTSFLIPGKVAHVAMCVDKGEGVEYEIAEMTNKGFTKSFFFDVAKESTWIAIGRPQVGDGYLMKVINRVRSFDKTKYDNQFENGADKLSCSEEIYEGDFERYYGIEPEYLPYLGRKYPTPDSVYHAKNIKIIWDSDNEI